MIIDKEAIIPVTCITIIIFLAFTMAYKPYIIEQRIQNKLQGEIQKNLDDKYAKHYSNLCGETEREVECVMTNTQTIYQYTRDEYRKEIRTPSQYAKLGGNCKDSAVLYATIFHMMNYSTKFVFPIPKHVNIIISKRLAEDIYRYCLIEGNTAECYNIKV